MNDPSPPGTGAMERSVSMERANVIAVALALPLAVLAVGPFWLLWGAGRSGAGIDSPGQVALAAGLVLASIVAHEALHLLGFVLAGAPRRALHYGVQRETLTPYAGCREPLQARQYRVAVVLPALVLGVLPLLASWALGDRTLLLYAYLMLLAAGGDLLILWLIRDLPGTRRVIDHPDRAGCLVLQPDAAAPPGPSPPD